MLSCCDDLRKLLAGAFVLIIALLATPLYGQTSDTTAVQSGGFWFGVGLGLGNGMLDCSQCGQLESNDPWNGGYGLSGYFAGGTRVHQNVLVGGELNVWARRSNRPARDATLFSIAPVMQIYPVAQSRLYLKGGAGLSLAILAGGNGLIESSGVSLQIGTGYDVPVGRRLALAPYTTFVQHLSAAGVGENQGESVRGPANPASVQFGLAVYWY